MHLKGLKKLGVNITEQDGYIVCRADKITGAEIHLDFPSVGATENIMLASVFAEGKTVITNVAMEPEIVDLQNFLNRMGAKISGAGTNKIVIKGVKVLKDVSYNIMPDRIESGTLLCAAAITGGKIKLENLVTDHITPIINKLEECGCKIEKGKSSLILEAPKRLRAVDIKTMPYPGFPTDMQSVFSAILCTAKGTSIITENIFENRYKCLNELKRMGANIKVEGKTAVIKGVRKLYKANVESTDLRGGAAVVIAALSAKGKTKVNNIEHILRGYEKFEKKLNKLGAKIQIQQ